jgi:choline dehydrogenase-like flavoprotein
MKKVIVVGSGAGGAAIAHKLQQKFQVTVLEAGREFRPFSFSLATLGKLRKTGLFFDAREIQLLFPAMQVSQAADQMILVRGRCLGGTTTLSAGNALRQDAKLRQLGIDLDQEFLELDQEIPITAEHQNLWGPTTRRLFEICQQRGLAPRPLPKLGDYARCTNCGRCVLGCPSGVKWDSRQFFKLAPPQAINIVTGCRVSRIIFQDGLATGVQTSRGPYLADIVIIAAGGFATPVILQNSGIPCEDKLFVDPVLCVAARQPGIRQHRELSMPFAVQREHYMVSPYFDHLSFFFNRKWHYPAPDILALMIKLADENVGSITGMQIKKTLTDLDKQRLSEGVELCKEIFAQYGIPPEDLFLGTVNAGHPGGMLPLTAGEAQTLHPPRLPDNVYVADASLFPASIGNPPMLTIMALAKKIGAVIIDKFG